MNDTPTTLRYPVTLNSDGTYAASEQASLTAVQDAVARIGSVELGELQEIAPWLGLPALEGRSTPPSPDAIREFLEDQEPDAQILVLRVPNPAAGEGWEALQIEVATAGDSRGD